MILPDLERAHGFSLVELLIALAICALLSAAVAGVVTPSREAFDETPAAIDLQQRGRTAIETLSQYVRSAGRNVGASSELGVLSDIIPAVVLMNPDPSGAFFTELVAIVPKLHAAQGALAFDQDGPAGSLTLAAAGCPNVKEVCGFAPGTSAVVADGTGRFDIFVVGSTDAGLRRLTAIAPFSQPYPAGSVVVESDAHIFRLDEHADGSRSLVRQTAAGAVQPIVDGISEIAFEPAGGDDMVPLAPTEFDDGPFWPGGPEDSYDDDWFRVRRIDIRVVVAPRETPSRRGAPRIFRASITLRNVR